MIQVLFSEGAYPVVVIPDAASHPPFLFLIRDSFTRCSWILFSGLQIL